MEMEWTQMPRTNTCEHNKHRRAKLQTKREKATLIFYSSLVLSALIFYVLSISTKVSVNLTTLANSLRATQNALSEVNASTRRCGLSRDTCAKAEIEGTVSEGQDLEEGEEAATAAVMADEGLVSGATKEAVTTSNAEATRLAPSLL